MRHLYNQTFPQPDSLEMREQLMLFNDHLKLIEAFTITVHEKTALNETSFEEIIYINE